MESQTRSAMSGYLSCRWCNNAHKNWDKESEAVIIAQWNNHARHSIKGKTTESVFIIKALHTTSLSQLERDKSEMGQVSIHLPHLPPWGHETNGLVQGCGWCRHDTFPRWHCDSVALPWFYLLSVLFCISLPLSHQSWPLIGRDQ